MDSEGFVGRSATGEVWGGRTFTSREGLERGLEMASFSEFWEVFLSLLSPEKNVEFSILIGDLVNFQDEGRSNVLCSFGLDLTYSHHTKLRQYILLHGNASSPVLEILKRDKISGCNLH